jgi:hypothetical protein
MQRERLIEGQTGMTKLMLAFYNFANAPNNDGRKKRI